MKEWVCFIEMDEKSSIGYYNGVPAVKVGTEIQLVEDGFSLYIPSETESQQWDRSDRRPYYIHPRRYHVRDGNWYDGKWVMPRGSLL